MDSLKKAKSELQVLRGIINPCTDSAIRLNVLAKIKIIERLLKDLDKQK